MLAWTSVPPEAAVEDRRSRRLRAAVTTRDRLASLATRLARGSAAAPGELTVLLNAAGQFSSAAMFVHMASTVMAARYRAAGQHAMADAIDGVRQVAERICSCDGQFEPPGATVGIDAPEANRALLESVPRIRRRLGPHATRIDFGDRDLHLCTPWLSVPGYAFTPWTCQQADWRFRWTDDARRRLAFLLACWDAYARCDDMLAGCAIGLSSFADHESERTPGDRQG